MRVLWRLWLWRLPTGGRVVQTRDQLHGAMAETPRRIVVEGDESLRAYAARLASDSESKLFQAAFGAPGASLDYMTSPVVGRIVDARDRKPRPKAAVSWRVESRVRGRLVLGRVRGAAS